MGIGLWAHLGLVDWAHWKSVNLTVLFFFEIFAHAFWSAGKGIGLDWHLFGLLELDLESDLGLSYFDCWENYFDFSFFHTFSEIFLWLYWSEIKKSFKNWLLSHFFTLEFILEYFQVWTIKLVNWGLQKEGKIHPQIRFTIPMVNVN